MQIKGQKTYKLPYLLRPVAQMRVEPRGTLCITCPVTLAQSTLGYLIPRFMTLYPQVNVDMYFWTSTCGV